jgi:hypothetical protein
MVFVTLYGIFVGAETLLRFIVVMVNLPSAPSMTLDAEMVVSL